MPSKKDVRKKAATHVLEMTESEAWHKFKKENPNERIGFQKFVQLKPCNVRHCKLSDRMLCLCVKCANVRLLREALNRTVKKVKKGDLKIENGKQMCEITMCDHPDEEFAKKECIDRKCKKCGSQKLIEFYKPLLDQHTEETVTVSQWIRKKVNITKTVKGQKITKEMTKILKEKEQT